MNIIQVSGEWFAGFGFRHKGQFPRGETTAKWSRDLPLLIPSVDLLAVTKDLKKLGYSDPQIFKLTLIPRGEE